MWNSTLNALNMFNYHCLKNKLLWPMAGQNRARLENLTECGEKIGRVRDAMWISKKKNTRNLLVGHSLMVIYRLMEMGYCKI